MTATGDTLERAQGCLLGQLAGDSLGGLVEFRSVDWIRRAYPDGCRELTDGGTWNNLAGQATDDSEMALMLARTLVRTGRYDRGAVLDAYIHWWAGAFDHGGTLRMALAPASAGRTPEDRLRLAAENANQSSQSNGSLMRISPLGIFGAGRPDRAAEWAREDSRLTHPHLICQDCCAVYVAAIAVAIAGGDARACHQAALAEADRAGADPEVRAALQAAQLGPPADYVTQQGWVKIALHNAFYQVLHAASVEEGVVDTVMRGGDTDTTAAIAGALLGAVHGRRQVPARWVEVLRQCRPVKGAKTAHPRPEEFWPVDAPELAEQLLAVGQACP